METEDLTDEQSRCGPKASETSRRHSKAKGACAIMRHRDLEATSQGEARRLDLTLVGGKSMAQMFIPSANASSTRLTTNWPVRAMLRVVSLGL